MGCALTGARIVAAIAMVAVLSGCDGGSSDAPGPAPSTGVPSTVAASPGAASASAEPRPPASSGPAPGFECPVTRPAAFVPPPGVEPDELFGAATAYGNGQLWVGALGENGVIAEAPAADGWIGRKLGWWRLTEGRLQITGRRLDATAPELRASVPDGYGPAGFQSSGVRFPTEGCWQVEGRVGATTLTFVTLVVSLQ